MGTNRRAQQFQYTYYTEVHNVFGKATIGASGAPTLVPAQSRGITSITRTAQGKYRLVLDSKYPYFLSGSVTHMSPGLQATAVKLTAEDVGGSTPYVDFAVTNPLSGIARTVPTGITEVQTFTAQAKGSCVDGDYIWFYDNELNRWAVAIDLTGSSAEPTGANWVATAAANRVQADISSDTTAAQVMATIETALGTLTGFSDKFTTNDTAADGTMIVTWKDKREQIAIADPQQDDDAAAGTSITAASTTDGREGAVSIANDTIQIFNHNFPTALPVQVYGSNDVPGGLTQGLTYYVIVSDVHNIQLATSAANAAAGTAINLTSDATADGTLEIVPQTQASEAVDPDSGDTLYFALNLRASDVK
jgi:hypothetical protein